jgi:hypothetical protein
MRGRRRSISSLIAESLATRPAGRLAALKAAFAEACGQPLARQAAARGLTEDGRVLVVARSVDWAHEVERLAGPICELMAARLGTAPAGLAVLVDGPSERE